MRITRCFPAATLLFGGIVAVPSTCEPPAPQFQFPELFVTQLDIRPEDSRARPPKMVVEGHVTDVPWVDFVPEVCAITDDLYFFNYRSIDGEDYVWNRRSKRLISVGHCNVHRVTSLGCVTVRQSPAETPAAERIAEVIDFDPMTGEPRTRWRLTGEHASFRVLGGWDGKLALATSPSRVTVLAAGEAPRTIDVELGDFYWNRNCDSIRAGQLLVYGPPGIHYFKLPRHYFFSIGICDLDTGKTRAIGKAQGGWIPMGIDQPTASAAWISRENAEAHGELTPERFPLIEFLGGVGFVHEETFKVWPGPADGK